ncbi:MAG: autotransporter-associated beta strand repeat-containing protein [Luteolibacter sp.]
MKPKYTRTVGQSLPGHFTLNLLRACPAIAISIITASLADAANVWDGGGANGNWGSVLNWDNDTLPAFPQALTFDGSLQVSTNNDQVGVGVTGITFPATAGTFTLAGNSLSLSGTVANNSTNLQTFTLPLALTAAPTFNAASGNITLSGVMSGSFGFTKSGTGTLTISGANSNTGGATINAGTVKLGASNVLSSTAGITFGNSATGTLDLAGFSQNTGLFGAAAANNAGTAGTVTSSAAGGSLTMNAGNSTASNFSQVQITGQLALTISGNNAGNLQLQNSANTFSGGLTIKNNGVAVLSTANLAVAGGLTGQATEGLRTSTAGALGANGISLDNGQLFLTTSQNVTNAISVSSRGGVFHMEGTGNATGGFTGAITNASGLAIVNSNSGNNNIIKIGVVSGFNGTMALDTTNLGGVAFNETSLGNSNMNLLWFGNSGNGGTGRVQYRGTGDATLTFGELNNLNSGAVGSTFSGAMENAIAATTATFSIGNSNATPATFQGVIRNGSGTVAITKTGMNNQILSGGNSYTGATTINGGTLTIIGSLASGSAVAVNSTGKLALAGGTVGGAVTVAGGGTLAGRGNIGGVVTLASGNSAGTRSTVDMVDSTIASLFLTDPSGLTIGGSAGNSNTLNFETGGSTTDSIDLGVNALNVGAGGATISITSLGVTGGHTYDLITFGSGTGAGFVTGTGTTVGGLTLANPSLAFGVTGILNVTATAVQLITSGASSPASAYWSGSKGSSWTSNSGGSGNFTTTAPGGTFITTLPGSSTNVFFANNSPTNLSNSLGGNFDINSLTFLAATSGASTITGANILSVETGGITLQAGNGGATLGMTTLTLGDDQTWTNNSSNPLTVTATVNGTLKNLTLAGNSINLGGSSFTCGALTVNANLNVAGTSLTIGDFDGSGSISNTGVAATVNATIGNDSTYAGIIADGGAGTELSLIKNGPASLTLSGANSYSGLTSVNSGTLVLGSSSALGNTTGGTSVANSGTIDLNGQSISEVLSVTGTGASGAGAIINSNTSAAASLDSEITNGAPMTVGGDGALTLQRVKGGIGPTILTKVGAGELTLGNGATSGHMNLLSLDVTSASTVNLGISSGNFIVADRGLRVTGGGVVRYAGSSTNMLVDACEVILTNGTLDLNGKTDTIGKITLGDGTNNGVISGGSASILTVQNTYNTFNTNTSGLTSSIELRSGSIDAVIAAGPTVAVNKTTLGTVTLTGLNTYTGNTNVTEGTLSLSQPFLADTSSVAIGATGVLNLTHTDTDEVAALTINGVVKGNGVYSALTDPGFITGTGKIRIGPALAGYASWSADPTNGLTAGVNDGMSADPDGDGIVNLLEYILGGIPAGTGASNTSILPAETMDATNLTLTFRRSDLSESDTTLTVQWSTNLTTWNDFATIGAASALPAVTVTEDSPTTALDTVSVAIPRSNAVGGKLYARIHATNP